MKCRHPGQETTPCGYCEQGDHIWEHVRRMHYTLVAIQGPEFPLGLLYSLFDSCEEFLGGIQVRCKILCENMAQHLPLQHCSALDSLRREETDSNFLVEATKKGARMQVLVHNDSTLI